MASILGSVNGRSRHRNCDCKKKNEHPKDSAHFISTSNGTVISTDRAVKGGAVL
jgi:hypothetical protein